jgi:hypothetical protein
MFVPFSVRMRRAGLILQKPLGYSFSGPQWVEKKAVVDMQAVDQVVDTLKRFVMHCESVRKADMAKREARAQWLREMHTSNWMDLYGVHRFEVSWYDLNDEAEAFRCVEDAFLEAEWAEEAAAAEVVRRAAAAESERLAAIEAARVAAEKARREAENQRLLSLSDAAFRQICADKLRLCRNRGQDEALLQRWIARMWAERERICAMKAVAAAPQRMLHNRQQAAAVRVPRVVVRTGHFSALDSDDE